MSMAHYCKTFPALHMLVLGEQKSLQGVTYQQQGLLVVRQWIPNCPGQLQGKPNKCANHARLWWVCWWLMVLQTTEWIVMRERRQWVCAVVTSVLMIDGITDDRMDRHAWEMATSVRGCDECVDDWWYYRRQNGSSCVRDGSECARLWRVCWWLMVLQTTEWNVMRERWQRVCLVC